jgi:hypothetical protein
LSFFIVCSSSEYDPTARKKCAGVKVENRFLAAERWLGREWRAISGAKFGPDLPIRRRMRVQGRRYPEPAFIGSKKDGGFGA